MGDRMTPISFGGLMQWILAEKKESGRVFGLRQPFCYEGEPKLSIFGEALEAPFGPAAGPHTQLAQNIIAAYYAGSRFFELKTVQIIDGEELPVNKPCILAEDEGYNCEWSTELTVPQAFEEYVKAWFALKVLAKEFSLGSSDGFVFNLSVGYDLDGIRSGKIDRFIEGMKSAKDAPIFKECKEYLLSHLDQFSRVDEDFVNGISDRIAGSCTLSTLHGCPPQEIERIAAYLLEEKGLHTFIKCNPTLLGYEEARGILDLMGYDYVTFGEFHFQDDLQFEDAVPMLERLQALADQKGLEFGVKITNTFPVDVTNQELPSEEMYMSGRSLYALSLRVACKLSERFEGRLRISYSGGADYFNCLSIYHAGIWPVTMATTLLKPGGYQRFTQIAKEFSMEDGQPLAKIDVEALQMLCRAALKDPRHTKAKKTLPRRKLKKRVPLLDCFIAPCREACPIHQDIPAYLKLVGEGRYREALQVIMDKNPLPFITGAICSHRCTSGCTRNFYEDSVRIREAKWKAAKEGYEEMRKSLQPEKASEAVSGKKTAVVGGGPAGMAAAHFLARQGMEVTLFEKEEELGGVVRYVIPEFRISSETVEKDRSFLEALGVHIVTGREITSREELQQEGYDFIILAVGASLPGKLSLQEGSALHGLEFLRQYKAGSCRLGKNVAVIGGGNTAMDVARAALRAEGVEKVSLVYRRDQRNMPADQEELLFAETEGVAFCELLSPVSHKDGKLLCQVMKLGRPDASGRRAPEETGEYKELAADTVLAAVGERIDASLYQAFGLALDERGKALTDENRESSEKGIYVVGDGLGGPATVVEGIRDAMLAANAVLGAPERESVVLASDVRRAAGKKGILQPADKEHPELEEKRCLECHQMCEVCVDVCPNRANVAVRAEGRWMPQILHMDRMCNECGNCATFCPYDSAPYKDKFTLFQTPQDMDNSQNSGFCLLDAADVEKSIHVRVRRNGEMKETDLMRGGYPEDAGLELLMKTVACNYSYLWKE